MRKRDWTEDFRHENGRYSNVCYRCNEEFRGHKRRPVCKECSPPTAERDALEAYLPGDVVMTLNKRADDLTAMLGNVEHQFKKLGAGRVNHLERLDGAVRFIMSTSSASTWFVVDTYSDDVTIAMLSDILSQDRGLDLSGDDAIHDRDPQPCGRQEITCDHCRDIIARVKASLVAEQVKS